MPKKKDVPAKRAAFKYRPRFGLILEVPDEPAQRREFNQLKRLGYQPRVVVV